MCPSTRGRRNLQPVGAAGRSTFRTVQNEPAVPPPIRNEGFLARPASFVEFFSVAEASSETPSSPCAQQLCDATTAVRLLDRIHNSLAPRQDDCDGNCSSSESGQDSLIGVGSRPSAPLSSRVLGAVDSERQREAGRLPRPWPTQGERRRPWVLLRTRSLRFARASCRPQSRLGCGCRYGALVQASVSSAPK